MKENTDFEQDLAIKTQTNTDNITNDLTTMVAAPKSQSEFKDTFRHFTDQPIENNYNIDPYDGNDFSYF
jgi:carbohydrate-binding DOMON domain-containing protein